MGSDKKIIVQRGAKLIVDGGRITNLFEDKYWRGIIVHGNATKEQPNVDDVLEPDDSGVVYITNSQIVFAEQAIRASGEGVLSYAEQKARWGGLIVAEDSQFYNNKVAAGFMKYDFSNKSRFINLSLIHI